MTAFVLSVIAACISGAVMASRRCPSRDGWAGIALSAVVGMLVGNVTYCLAKLVLP